MVKDVLKFGFVCHRLDYPGKYQTTQGNILISCDVSVCVVSLSRDDDVVGC